MKTQYLFLRIYARILVIVGFFLTIYAVLLIVFESGEFLRATALFAGGFAMIGVANLIHGFVELILNSRESLNRLKSLTATQKSPGIDPTSK